MDEETSSETLGSLPGSQCKTQKQSEDSSSGLLTSRTQLLYARCYIDASITEVICGPKGLGKAGLSHRSRSSVSQVSQVLTVSSDSWQGRFSLVWPLPA